MMNKSESIKELAAALGKAQAQMPAVQMNAVNPFLKNKYADLGAIIATAKPILAKHGLSVSQLPTSVGDQVGVTTMLMHESGEWLSTEMSLSVGDEKGKSSAQVAGSVITYLRRYSLASMLGMYADEDGDGNAPKPQAQAKPQAKPKPEPEQEQPATFEYEGVTYNEKVKTVCNSDGTPYYMLSDDELSKRFNYYEQKDSLTEEENLKHRAAKHCLKARHGAA